MRERAIEREILNWKTPKYKDNNNYTIKNEGTGKKCQK